ncbi:MAG: LPXTG cell wall anchor domain-containing protein [Clostridiales bacterium]|nr:LPXTG cell wall anchor domain-containing protein [Clostridiales bacterium]
MTSVANGKDIVSLFDISLMQGDKKVQPNGKVRVTLTLTQQQLKEYKDFKIMYIDASGNAAIIESTVSGNEITFETDHFSGYGIIGTKISDSKTPATGDGTYLGWMAALVLSGSALLLVGRKRKKEFHP